MYKMIKRISLTLLICFFLIWIGSINSFAISTNEIIEEKNIELNQEEIQNNEIENTDKKYDYIIEKYIVNINVNEDNTYDITENILVNFNKDKHGIIRKIPLSNNIKRTDGTSNTNRVKLTNISINDEYTISKENNQLYIKIGNKEKILKGLKEYKIKYKYNIGNDQLKDKDEVYLNIIGTEWDTIIKNVSFTITMPKKFDKNKLIFSSGVLGSTTNEFLNFKIDENKIIGAYNNILQPKEGLTMRVELPNGYFIKQKLQFTNLNFLLFFISTIGLIFSIFLWYKYGRINALPIVLNFYPPKGLNPYEVEYLYTGMNSNKAYISILIYFANKGYLKIIQNSNEDYIVIHKLKEYDGKNSLEKKILNDLFKNDNYVYEQYLKQIFYKTRLFESVHKKYYELVFNKFLISKKILLYLSVCLIYCSVIFVPTILFTSLNYSLFTTAIFELIGLFFSFSLWFNKDTMIKYESIFKNTNILYILELLFKKDKNIFSKIILGFFCICFCTIIPFIFIRWNVLTIDYTYFINYIYGLFSCFIILFFLQKFNIKTEYGRKIKTEIEGFKQFFDSIQKEKLQKLIKNNFDYYYSILPFLYVLNISDNIFEKLEDLLISDPIWLESNQPFMFDSLFDFMQDILNPTVSSTDNDSSSSTDCSSGGGSGGGGGSSW